MPESPLDFRTANTLWGSVLAATLARCGLRQAVISPGSRSTPLTLALAANRAVESIPVLDERSAAFFALGLARQHGRPTALVCTSGTAGANYFPAVIEAQESGVPLLILTADRPPEMRECASGQTIDQQKLFGAHVGFYHELALPEASLPLLRYLRQTLVHAFGRTLAPAAGPVHLNVPFRDPLVPEAGANGTGLESATDWGAFLAEVIPPPPTGLGTQFPAVGPAERGIIVVGPNQPADPAGFAAQVGMIARKLGWPVLAEGLSPLRNQPSGEATVVTTYDTVLRNATLAAELRPERVLAIGGWPTSKVLRAWLTAVDAPTVLVTDGGRNRDALHGRTQMVHGSLVDLAEGLTPQAGSGSYARRWAGLEAAARAALDHALEHETALFEGRAAWLLARHLPTRTPLLVANSMPVRDVEYFWPRSERGIEPRFNRGANGIDGTLSTALGLAHGNRPTVLLTGDLALLHDANGFLLHSRLRGSLTIVLVNNQGGGIFEHLPVAQVGLAFEEFFATPQRIDFARLCAAHGVEHVTVRDWTHFNALVATLPLQGVRVLELRTDRKRDAATRKTLFASIAAALNQDTIPGA
ncbi:MAG: 2-succinyl-5-enolpyruvyl-6-hydroxy-3-cyclohexene-1-carboxylic-acid synthase [Verrucomicrobia bacterium]|nr:2-succinyl-5-enolpyruvyl-6-hydroxy-3-cyclohexene-1-carboxylic-acid synthase [Verrucomicrobiota bacterium]